MACVKPVLFVEKVKAKGMPSENKGFNFHQHIEIKGTKKILTRVWFSDTCRIFLHDVS